MSAAYRIGVVATGGRITPELAEQARAFCAAEQGLSRRPELVVHPQCFLSSGHFAGTDTERADAFVELANDPSLDAIWFARGGYGADRILDLALPRLGPAARTKRYMGYSDLGVLFAALYREGFETLFHGPMVVDLSRDGGEAAARRALAWLIDDDPAALEPSVAPGGPPTAAFNMVVFSKLIGTPYQPDLAGHVLMLEEVGEYTYRIDRSLFHITGATSLRGLAGLRLGRCSAVPENDPVFGRDEAELAEEWCRRHGLAWLGRADIGHDVDNKVVPFGRLVGTLR